MLCYCRLRDIAGEDAHVPGPSLCARGMHKNGHIILDPTVKKTQLPITAFDFFFVTLHSQNGNDTMLAFCK